MRGCESVLCVSTGRMSAAQLGGREGGGQRRGDRAEDPEGKSAAAVTGAQNAGKLSGTGLSLERDGETKPGNLFSLQVGAEAEGSGLGWGLDVGSGSGDLVHSEELLRVSVKGSKARCRVARGGQPS